MRSATLTVLPDPSRHGLALAGGDHAVRAMQHTAQRAQPLPVASMARVRQGGEGGKGGQLHLFLGGAEGHGAVRTHGGAQLMVYAAHVLHAAV